MPNLQVAKLRQALLQIGSSGLIEEKLVECLHSDRDRMAAITLILAYNLGKPKESIEVNSASSPLPALSPETLACLVRDMQASQAPIVEAAYTVQENPPSPDSKKQG